MGDAKDEFMRDEQQDDQQATLGAESAMTSFLMKQAAGTAGGKLTEREFHES